MESDSRKISNAPQKDVFITYKGMKLRQFFRPDFICYDKIIVEIKALDRLTSREEAQLLNYLKATGLSVGILINFGAERDLEWKRMILTPNKPVRVPGNLTPAKTARINDPKPIRED